MACKIFAHALRAFFTMKPPERNPESATAQVMLEISGDRDGDSISITAS